MHLHAPVVKVVIYHQSAISEKSLVEGHPANGVGRVGAELIRGRAAARPGIPTPDARRRSSRVWTVVPGAGTSQVMQVTCEVRDTGRVQFTSDTVLAPGQCDCSKGSCDLVQLP